METEQPASNGGIKLLCTHVPNLDEVLGGGVPVYSLNIIAGAPGSGKTILAQQLLFGHVRANPQATGLYLTTLSEPIVKVVRYMQQFGFFDGELFGQRVVFGDSGQVLREHTLTNLAEHILALVEQHRPEVLVIDSFKAIHDQASEAGAFRRFTYDLAVRLSAIRCTTFLVGEYERKDVASSPEFSVADGILFLQTVEREGELGRYLQVLKLRGCAPMTQSLPFVIDDEGLSVLRTALTIPAWESSSEDEGKRVASGLAGLDAVLHGGIPSGRAVILSGASGTGKTTFALQFLVHGARQGQRGILYSFEERPERLRHVAKGFGWDLEALERDGLLRVVFIPQTDIRVTLDLERIARDLTAFRPHRVVVDSFSVFLHKVNDSAAQREKTFQLVTVAHRIGCVSLLISDIPAGESSRLSRFGVEETVADGTIVLSSGLIGVTRRRHIEVYKMRGTDHVTGRHRMEIGAGGIEVLYAEPDRRSPSPVPKPIYFTPIDSLIRGDLPYGAAWLTRGEPGVGKSTLAAQFALEGLKRGEAVLYVAADALADRVRQSMERFGHPIAPFIESRQLVILDVFATGSKCMGVSDPDAFLFHLSEQAQAMPRPLRLVLDSLTPFALAHAPKDFVELVHRKNRLLQRPDTVLFDTLLPQTLPSGDVYSLLNAFDLVLDLYTPDWGEMKLAGNVGYRALRVSKLRVGSADTRPFPYTLSPSEGVVVQKGFYRQQLGGV